MQIKCGKCGKTMNVPGNAAGKKIRCNCGETLTIPNVTGGPSNASNTRTGYKQPAETYWWLMTYIRINRILGYVFLALIGLGAVAGGFTSIGTLYVLSELPMNEFIPAALTLFVTGVLYILGAFVYLVIWFASADFLRAVVEVAENTRRIK